MRNKILSGLLLISLSFFAFVVGAYLDRLYVKSSWIIMCMTENGHYDSGPCEFAFDNMLKYFDPIEKTREMNEFAEQYKERNKKNQVEKVPN